MAGFPHLRLKPNALLGKLGASGHYVLAAFVASFYISTSLSIFFSVLVLLLWLALGHYRTLVADLRQTPVAIWALGLYLLCLVGVGYGDASFADALAMLGKYREWLLIAVLLAFFHDRRYQDWAWRAVVWASVLGLLVSCLMYFDILAVNRQGDPCLKSRITHSLLTAFFMFYCLHQAHQGPAKRLGYGLLAALAVCNVFFMVQGRTGQLTAVALGLLFMAQRLKVRQTLWALLVMAGFLTLFLVCSDKSARIYEGIANTQAYFQDPSQGPASSMGLRYTFWQHSWQLIQERPLFGHGTGSFAAAYQSLSPDVAASTRNPHNEFLMIGVQWGGLGLLAYWGFWASLSVGALGLAAPQRWYAQGLTVALLLASLFNSPFLDHSGHWFAAMIALVYGRYGKDAPA